MKILFLILICVIQGITEFLPVSSSGHLYLIEQLFGFNGNVLVLNLILHLASLLAVVIFYRKKIFSLLKKPFQPLGLKLILSTIVTVLLVIMYKIFNIEIYVFKFYGFCFLITALLLLILDFFQKKACVIKKKGITIRDAFIVGISQGVAVLPGISRSGSTVSTLLFLGCEEKESAEYSFLMSFPIIIGGFVFEILSNKANSYNIGLNFIEIIIAFTLTFFVSLLSIKLFVKFLKNRKMFFFAVYLLLLGIFTVFINY